MKNVIFTFIALFFTSFTFAQNAADAKLLLDEVSKTYKSSDNFYIQFQTKLNNSSTGTADQYDGEVYVASNKYNLTIDKMDVNQIYDGTKLYTISKDLKEVTVTKPTADSDELFTPTRVFEMYKNGYSFGWDKAKTLNGKSVKVVKLTPTGSSDIKHVLVAVDAATKQLVELTEVTKNGTTTTVTVTKQQRNIIIPSAMLKFDEKFFSDYYVTEI